MYSFWVTFGHIIISDVNPGAAGHLISEVLYIFLGVGNKVRH